MIRTNLSWALPTVVTLLLYAATPALAANKADARLDGDWQIDTAASDDFDARLQRMAEELRAKRRNRRGAMGGAGPGGPDGGYESGTVPGMAEELPPESRDELQDRLGETFRPPAQLNIETVGDEIVMHGDALPERRFRLFETVTRMDISGTATISTRWSGPVLLVQLRYTNRSRSEVRYAVDRSGALLNVTLKLSDAIGGKLELHSTYRRSTP